MTHIIHIVWFWKVIHKIHVTFSDGFFGNIHVSSGPIEMQVDWDMTRYRMRKDATYCITRR